MNEAEYAGTDQQRSSFKLPWPVETPRLMRAVRYDLANRRYGGCGTPSAYHRTARS